MKNCIVIAALMMLCAVGCIPTVQQVQTATNKTDALMVVVDKMQESFDVLVENGIVESEKLEAVSEEIDNAQETLVAVNEAIKKKADEGVVEQLRAANQASAPVNPYAPMIDVVLKILAGTGILYGAPKIVKTVRERNDIAARYSAAKVGMDKFRNENPDKAAELYNDISEARKAKKIA